MKKYKVTLAAEERNSLQELIVAKRTAAKKVIHARILLKADAGPDGPAWTDARIADALEVDVSTVERVRERFVEQGRDEWQFTTADARVKLHPLYPVIQ